jgi:hypothetical protein
MTQEIAINPSLTPLRTIMSYRSLQGWRAADQWSWRARPKHSRGGVRRRWERSIQDYVSGRGRGGLLDAADDAAEGWWKEYKTDNAMRAPNYPSTGVG